MILPIRKLSISTGLAIFFIRCNDLVKLEKRMGDVHAVKECYIPGRGDGFKVFLNGPWQRGEQ